MGKCTEAMFAFLYGSVHSDGVQALIVWCLKREGLMSDRSGIMPVYFTFPQGLA